MTREHEAGPAAMRASPGAQPDPRAVRVTLVGRDDGGAPIALVMSRSPIEHGPDAAGAPAERPADVQAALVDGAPVAVHLQILDAERAVLVLGGARGHRTRLLLLPPASRTGTGRGIVRREVVVDGWRMEVDVEPAGHAALRERAVRDRPDAGHSGPTEVRAMIPGVVVSVAVAAGDSVAVGQQLLVVEAMKMQNELRASRDGIVERVLVGAGRTIDLGDLLLVIA